jgi:GMP synthase PP-ATPase subunit
MSDNLVEKARHNVLADMPHYASVELIEAMADRIKELEAKLAKAVKLMELSVELATWNTALLDDVIFFITELKETDQ